MNPKQRISMSASSANARSYGIQNGENQAFVKLARKTCLFLAQEVGLKCKKAQKNEHLKDSNTCMYCIRVMIDQLVSRINLFC